MENKKKESSGLTIRFKDFYQDVNGVTFYKINVYQGQNMWEFEERYSSMRDIHKNLRESYKGDLPDFPTKKWFGNTDKNFLSQRKATLQTYFTNILNHIDISKYPILTNFFYRNKNNQTQNDASSGNAGNNGVGSKSEISNNNSTSPDRNKNINVNNNQNNNNKKNNEGQNQQNNKNGNEQNANNKTVSEAQIKAKRAEVFAQTMSKINEKVQSRFITNISDFQNYEPINEQKRVQINLIKFNLKSQLLPSLSLPMKYVDNPDLALNVNMNQSQINHSLDQFSDKFNAIFLAQHDKIHHIANGIILPNSHHSLTN